MRALRLRSLEQALITDSRCGLWHKNGDNLLHSVLLKELLRNNLLLREDLDSFEKFEKGFTGNHEAEVHDES